ncbi:MAG: phosphoglycerate kinase [Elusimicrobiota bacterium]
MNLKRMQDLDVKDKRVLVRVDYNVPLQGDVVADATRIRRTLPTLKHLIGAGARLVLISHLGRPKGKPAPKYSLRPVAGELGGLLGAPVRFAEDCVGDAADAAVSALKPGEVALLENLRFHAEEESNDPAFSERLAKHGEVFIQDAFGALHRAHASTAGIPKHLSGGIGLLVQKELEFLEGALSEPKRPFIAILGGAKVSDKLKVVLRLLDRVDAVLIGGGMAYTFLHAQGIAIGRSLLEEERVEDARSVLETAQRRGVEVLLPADHLTAGEVREDAETALTETMAIPGDGIGVDIGPRTIELFKERISGAQTVFWNGPMGVFEMAPFAKGSFAVAEAMAEATAGGALTIVGGGDSLAVVSAKGLADRMSHCSTGGGASLELLEGRVLPGLSALSA